MMTQGRKALITAAAAAVALWAAPTAAESVAEFYKGKTVEIVVGAAVGGGYDLPGRLVGRHIGRHIPGKPNVIVKNMPGSASLRMTNWLYNVGAQDGTVIGMPNNNIPLEPRLHLLSPDRSNMHFDVNKMHWIGTPVQEPQALWVWHAAPVKTVEDLKAHEIQMGATSVAADNATLPKLMNVLLGTKMKVVAGYKGQAAIFIAAERGEIQGNTTGLSNLFVHKSDWLKDGKLRVVVQFAVERDPKLRDVPTAVELLSNAEDRELMRTFLFKYKMARPFAMGPGVPADRVAAIRAAFDATMKDPAYIAEARKIGLDVNPLGGAEVEKLIAHIQAMPDSTAKRLQKLLARPGGRK